MLGAALPLVACRSKKGAQVVEADHCASLGACVSDRDEDECRLAPHRVHPRVGDRWCLSGGEWARVASELVPFDADGRRSLGGGLVCRRGDAGTGRWRRRRRTVARSSVRCPVDGSPNPAPCLRRVIGAAVRRSVHLNAAHLDVFIATQRIWRVGEDGVGRLDLGRTARVEAVNAGSEWLARAGRAPFSRVAFHGLCQVFSPERVPRADSSPSRCCLTRAGLLPAALRRTQGFCAQCWCARRLSPAVLVLFLVLSPALSIEAASAALLVVACFGTKRD